MALPVAKRPSSRAKVTAKPSADAADSSSLRVRSPVTPRDRLLREMGPEIESHQARALRLRDAISASAAARAESHSADDKGGEDLERTLQKLAEQSRPVANTVRLCLRQIDARSFRHGKKLTSTAEELERVSHEESEAQMAESRALARRLVAQREAMLRCLLAELRHAEEDSGARSIRSLEALVRSLQADVTEREESIEALEAALRETEAQLAEEREARREDATRWAVDAMSMQREAEAMEARIELQRVEIDAGAAARQSCWEMACEIEGLSRTLKAEQDSRQVVVGEYRQKLASRGAAAEEEQQLMRELLAVSHAEHAATRSRLGHALEEATAGKEIFESALRATATERWVSLSRHLGPVPSSALLHKQAAALGDGGEERRSGGGEAETVAIVGESHNKAKAKPEKREPTTEELIARLKMASSRAKSPNVASASTSRAASAVRASFGEPATATTMARAATASGTFSPPHGRLNSARTPPPRSPPARPSSAHASASSTMYSAAAAAAAATPSSAVNAVAASPPPRPPSTSYRLTYGPSEARGTTLRHEAKPRPSGANTLRHGRREVEALQLQQVSSAAAMAYGMSPRETRTSSPAAHAAHASWSRQSGARIGAREPSPDHGPDALFRTDLLRIQSVLGS